MHQQHRGALRGNAVELEDVSVGGDNGMVFERQAVGCNEGPVGGGGLSVFDVESFLFFEWMRLGHTVQLQRQTTKTKQEHKKG